MTSCPDEADVVLLLDDTAENTGPHAEAVIAHLAECEACRLLLARSEASLRAALGGIADAEAVVETMVAADRPRPRVLALRRYAAAAAVLAAAAAGWAFARGGAATQTPGAETAAAAVSPRTIDEEMRDLLAEAARLAATPAPDEQGDDIALAALAAAEARIDLGVPTGDARLRDVVERFPGTSEAREARARLASLGETR